MEGREEIDPVTLPAKKKKMKRDVLKKLLYRATLDIFQDNPIGALYSLVEKECFRLDIIEVNKNFKGLLYIDGRVFESDIINQKKKARDAVVVKVLKYLFPDIIQELYEQQNSVKSAQADVTLPVMSVNTTLQAKTKLSKLHINEQNGVHSKKVKQDFAEKTYNVDFMKKGLKSNVVERIIQQALGLCDCPNPNTVTTLFSLFEKDVFHFDVETIDQSKAEFGVSLHLGDKVYHDFGSSIKKAKSNVTKKALRDLFPQIACSTESSAKVEVSKSQACSVPVVNNISNGKNVSNCTVPQSGVPVPESLQPSSFSCFSDFIASTVQSKYENIMQSQPDYLQRYSVLSGIVMIQNDDLSRATVICLSTGNKCLAGDQVTTAGDVLFDCHAEILSKRCLVSYLYSQLYLSLTTNVETILELSTKDLYRVKNTVKFYLYISSAPCGDGRVFNFSTPKKPNSNRIVVKRGILRVKLESGMGGIPVSEYSSMVPVYEDYLKGRPLVIMCCSAKLMRTNVLGVQGALLSYFLEPVYFDGILIGDIFHKGNLIRALYDRVSDLQPCQIPEPYRINKPFIEGITNSQIAVNIKPGKSCMNWVVNEPNVELISTKTGKTLTASISYKVYKESSDAYQKTKQLFFEVLEKNGRGKWLRKPKEINLFFLADGKQKVGE